MTYFLDNLKKLFHSNWMDEKQNNTTTPAEQNTSSPESLGQATPNTKPNPPQENAILNIVFNIAIPVFLLNKGSHYFGPVNGLLLALAFPFAYGAWDLYKRKKMNYISLLGLVHILFTGGFALSGLTGIWFAFKEAAFPTLIGAFVAYSASTKKPFIKTLFLNPQLFHTDVIEEKVNATPEKLSQFNELLKKSTFFMSISFFISAVINFLLSVRIFAPIPEALAETERKLMLNEQLGEMTKYSFAVILIPSMIMLMSILWYMIKGIERITEIPKEQLFKS